MLGLAWRTAKISVFIQPSLEVLPFQNFLLHNHAHPVSPISIRRATLGLRSTQQTSSHNTRTICTVEISKLEASVNSSAAPAPQRRLCLGRTPAGIGREVEVSSLVLWIENRYVCSVLSRTCPVAGCLDLVVLGTRAWFFRPASEDALTRTISF